MTWKRCDGCTRAISSTAFTCDYCGHVCQDVLSFLPSDDGEQPAIPWPEDDLAAVEGLSPRRSDQIAGNGDRGDVESNVVADTRTTGLPPLELNDTFPFAHVFEARTQPEVAATEDEAGADESGTSPTLASLFPLNDRPGSEDPGPTPYLTTGRPASEDPGPTLYLTTDRPASEDPGLTPYSTTGRPASERPDATPYALNELRDDDDLGFAEELLNDQPESARHDLLPVAVGSSPATAGSYPVAAGSAVKLGTRQMAMMGGALFAAAALIFTILSMRGSASPEPAPAAVSAPAAPRTSAGSATAAARPKAASALPSVMPRWNVVAEGRWIGSDRKTVAFELQAVNKIHIWTRDVTPMLVVRCQAGRIEPFVFTQSAARMEVQDEDHSVRVAFDDGPETTERWPDSEDHDALFARDGAAFARQLAAARTLRFGFTPHNAEPATARFEVAGISDLLTSTARQCGWKN